MALELPAEIFSILNESIALFTRPILLKYPVEVQECPNCYLENFGAGGRSTSRYKSGGPYPFSAGMPCPYCNGVGSKDILTTEEIQARIYWDRQSWYRVGIPINIPEHSFQMICYMEDLPKLLRANSIVVEYDDINQIQNMEYFRFGDSYPQTFRQNPQKYAITYWKKNG